MSERKSKFEKLFNKCWRCFKYSSRDHDSGLCPSCRHSSIPDNFVIVFYLKEHSEPQIKFRFLQIARSKKSSIGR